MRPEIPNLSDPGRQVFHVLWDRPEVRRADALQVSNAVPQPVVRIMLVAPAQQLSSRRRRHQRPDVVLVGQLQASGLDELAKHAGDVGGLAVVGIKVKP